MPPAEVDAQLDLSPRHLDLLRALLKAHVPLAEVWAFGSRVDGGAHEGSDLDLILRNGVDPEQPVDGADRLREALRDSLLPVTVDLHDWSNLPPSFRTAIERRHLRIEPA